MENQTPKKPENYMVFAVLTTVLCCLPAGIASIIYASKVNEHYASGNYEEAERASKNAKKWAIIGAVATAAFLILYFIGIAIFVGASGEF